MPDRKPATSAARDRLEHQTLIGERKVALLGGILDAMAVGSLLLVADQRAYRLSGAERAVGPILSRRRHEVFTGFQENPTLENIQAGIARLESGGYEAVLAVGGGSAIDVAKTVAACSSEEASPADLITGKASIACPGPPTVAVPTTAGTGAHTTHFSAIFVDGEKYSLAHRTMRPVVAIVDPELTYSMPPRLTTATGLDALCQAMESMWAVGSTDESRKVAREAIRLALSHLETAVLSPTPEARHGMCRASHLAGEAIDVSKTTAAHAMAYTFTTDYNVPHGMAAALTLAAVLQYNSRISDVDCIDPRGPEHVRGVVGDVVGLLGCYSPEDAGARIANLLKKIECPTRLAEVGVTTDRQRRMIASRVNAERLHNNPRRLDFESVDQLLASIQ